MSPRCLNGSRAARTLPFLPLISSRSWPKARVCAAVIALAGLGLGGCAQQPQQVAAAAGHSKEYFPSSVYGAASRRVIADGQPVPRGGGQYLVGKPYTIAGQTYYPSERRVTQIGLASWYGDAFHGRLTANGEIYDRDSFTAAHPTMPLPSYARVTNLRNNTSMIVRVNDRGPYHSNRVMDVSRRVADALDIRRTGTAKVKVEWVARASLAGSDDAKLAATLRTDGPALANGVEEGIQLATAPARAVIASLGAFAPTPIRAPPRPVRYVEQERPEALETYRAPRAAAAPRASRHEEVAVRRRRRDTRRAAVRSASAARRGRRRHLRDRLASTPWRTWARLAHRPSPRWRTAISGADKATIESRAATRCAATHEPPSANRPKASAADTVCSGPKRRCLRCAVRWRAETACCRRAAPSTWPRWRCRSLPTSTSRPRAADPTPTDDVVGRAPMPSAFGSPGGCNVRRATLLAVLALATVPSSTPRAEPAAGNGLQINVPNVILIDAGTRTVLFERGADDAVTPASTAKHDDQRIRAQPAQVPASSSATRSSR